MEEKKLGDIAREFQAKHIENQIKEHNEFFNEIIRIIREFNHILMDNPDSMFYIVDHNNANIKFDASGIAYPRNQIESFIYNKEKLCHWLLSEKLKCEVIGETIKVYW